MKKTIYSKLHGRTIEKLGSWEELANRMGISRQALYLKRMNRIGWSCKDIRTIKEILDIPEEEISSYFLL